MKAYTDSPESVDYEVRAYDAVDLQETIICRTFNEARSEASKLEKQGFAEIEIVATDQDESCAWWKYSHGKVVRT